MEARAIIETASGLRLETPEVSGNGVLHQITPGQATHQALIGPALHDNGTPSFVARLAQRIVRLGQQGREIVVAIAPGDPDHGERTAFSHGIHHQVRDTAVDEFRHILEL